MLSTYALCHGSATRKIRDMKNDSFDRITVRITSATASRGIINHDQHNTSPSLTLYPILIYLSLATTPLPPDR